jgi:hypothetical protein
MGKVHLSGAVVIRQLKEKDRANNKFSSTKKVIGIIGAKFNGTSDFT